MERVSQPTGEDGAGRLNIWLRGSSPAVDRGDRTFDPAVVGPWARGS